MDSRQNACEMRSAGHTIGEIAKVLCIAYSTAQFWTKGVALTEEQRLSQYTRGGRKLGHYYKGATGRYITRYGYVKIRAMRDDSTCTYLYEHRVVMSNRLGRPLLKHENVHHKDGNKLNNSPDNLELWVRPQPSGARAADLVTYT